MAPARVPRPIIEKINRDVIDIIRSAKVQEKLKAQYRLGLADTPAQFDAMIQNDTAALADVFKD
jgi:tripartite-type tricarboxylate transporter receptor subunit TctC